MNETTSQEFHFILDINRFRDQIKKNAKQYRRGVQRALADFMTETRISAAKEQMIANRFPSIQNPYYLRRKQPSDPTRLTSRTGKLKYMLEKTTRQWSGFGNILVKENTPGLAGLIRTERSGEIEAFKGTYRVDINPDSRLTAVGPRGEGSQKRHHMPIESTRTLAMRFRHETGIRGKARPFMHPAAQSRLAILRAGVEQAVKSLNK